MIDAAMPCWRAWADPDHIYFDKFTPARTRTTEQEGGRRRAMATVTKKKEERAYQARVHERRSRSAPSSHSGSRIYNYYKPRRTKGTMYEDVTVEVQPIGALLSQDWSTPSTRRCRFSGHLDGPQVIRLAYLP